MVREITVEEPLLRVQNTLGEGVVWDTRTQRLHWVDIDERRIYTYEPESGTHGFESFAGKMSSLALRRDEPGFISTSEYTFELIPSTSLPFPPTNSTIPQPTIDLTAELKEQLPKGTFRFNDGFCDPAGRFIAGTMGFEHGTFDAAVYVLEATGSDISTSKAKNTPRKLIDGVTCTNGTGWTKDGRTMYFTDSWTEIISQYDYITTTGDISNKRLFSKLDKASYGEPDGLCMDSQDGIWSARWGAGIVVRFNSAGEIDVIVHFPRAWNITCCCFGGPALDELYVTTANSNLAGGSQEKHDQGGDLFVVKDLGFRGFEKHRFTG